MRSFDITHSSGTFSPVLDTIVFSPVVQDSDGSLTASGTVDESAGIAVPTTSDTAGESVDVFDFTLADGGTADGDVLEVSEVRLDVSGTASDADRAKLTYRLTGPDAASVVGTYDGSSDVLTFSSLSVSVADGASETYTVSVFWNDNAGLSEDQSVVLSVDGDTDLTVGASGTQMGATSAVASSPGATIEVEATSLAFATSPAGSVSGAALTTQPVLEARDAFGNVDADFAETVTLTEAGAGSLSGGSVAATAGVATFTAVTYTATADQESLTLTANDQDGVGTDLPSVSAAALTSDVVATELVFSTSPAGSVSGAALTTQPVLEARDANGVVDTGFTETVTLAEASAGSLTGGSVAAVAGVATFADVTYTATADQESFTLTADDQDGVGADFSPANANSIVSDVVATQLVFSTEPAPVTVKSEESTAFTTVPVVEARDASGLLDTGYTTGITLAEVNGAGSAAMSGTGDTDGDGATVTVTPSSGVATFTDLAATYTADGASNETFNLQATSGALGTSDSATITATVNGAPTFDSGAGPVALALAEDADASDLTALLAVTDADAGQTLTWTVTSAPSSGTLDGFPAAAPSTGTVVTPSGLTYTPAADANGADSFEISVSDGDKTAALTFSVTVQAVNDAPSFVKGGDQTVLENAGEQTVAGWATDISAGAADEAGQTVTFGVTTDNPSLFSLAPAISSAGELTYTIGPDANGQATVSVVLSDDGGTADGGVDQSAAQSFTIEVGAVNSGPTISSLPNVVVLEDETSEPISFTVDDAETAAGQLTVRAESENDSVVTSAGVVIRGTGQDRTLTVTPVENASGSAIIRVIVSDGEDEGDAFFQVTVMPRNDPPTYPGQTQPRAGEDNNIELSGDPEQLVVIRWDAATDADGDTLRYAWELAADSTFEAVLLEVDADTSQSVTVTGAQLSSVFDSARLRSDSRTLYHRIRVADGSTTGYTGVATLTLTRVIATSSEDALPAELTLSGNYPNPLRSSTAVRYALPEASAVEIVLFDMTGRQVQVLVDEPQEAGWHEVRLDAGALPSGLYVYRLIADGDAKTRTMTVVK